MRELDTVVLRSALPKHGLESGDIGAVVTVYSPDAVEVEFVTASGSTRALITLKSDQVRPIGPDDIPAVRKQNAA